MVGVVIVVVVGIAGRMKNGCDVCWVGVESVGRWWEGEILLGHGCIAIGW